MSFSLSLAQMGLLVLPFILASITNIQNMLDQNQLLKNFKKALSKNS